MPTTKKRIIIYIAAGLIAIALIIAAVSANSGGEADSPAALLSLGERFLHELNYEQALVQFLRVIEIEPMSVRAYYGAARAYMGLGQTDNAIDILQRGIQITGDSFLREMLSAIESGTWSGSQPAGGADRDNTGDTVQAAEAPFTGAQLALVEQLTQMMLTGEYDGAYALLRSEFEAFAAIIAEYGARVQDSHVHLLFREIFFFGYQSYAGIPRIINVDMFNIHGGAGIHLSVNHLPENDAGEWTVTHYQNGQPNGLHEFRGFGEGYVVSERAVPVLNGLLHGEEVNASFINRTTRRYTYYAYGLMQPIGPEGPDGMVRTSRHVDERTGEYFGYSYPDNEAFTQPASVFNWFEHWSENTMAHFADRIPHYR